MTQLSAELRKAHQMLANMAAFMPQPDGQPEYGRHRDAYRIWSEQFPVPVGIAVADAPGCFPGLTVTTAASDANRVVLYVHGGGYQEGLR